MNTIANVFEHNIIVVFFFYGLAFFSMGLAIMLESRRSSEFPLAAAMAPLAGFGIVHGLQEWFEMFELLEEAGATNIPTWLLSPEIRIAHLVISFALLTVFGVQLIYTNHRKDGRERLVAYSAAAVLVAVWLLSLLISHQLYQPDREMGVTMADVLSRYILAFPGALLAGWAILLEQRTFRARGMSNFGRALLYAAVALLLYGTVGQLFTKPSVLFPSNVINSEVFLEVAGFPIQFFRALVAIIMAVALIRALRVFEIERQQRLQAAYAAREAAQREALTTQQKARAETEQLNRELQEAMQNLSSLYRFARSVATTLERDKLLHETLPQFIRAEPRITATVVFLREKPDRPLQEVVRTECEAGPPIKAQMQQQSDAVGRFAAEQGQAAYWTGADVAPLPEDNHITVAPGLTPQAQITAGRTIGVPLTVQDRVIGSLVTCTGPLLPPFNAQDVSFVSTVAGQLSIALQNAALYHEVQERELLRGELLRRVVSAQEQERQRIARELHDGTGQTLTALGLGLAAAQARLDTDPDVAAKQLAQLRDLNATALEELHHLIADLRPSVLDNLGLIPALRSQVQAFEERTGVRAHFQVNGQRRPVPPELEMIIFRIAQEALTNVTKHAGATAVNLQVTYADDAFYLDVSDNGRGFDVERALHAPGNGRTAWGLLGMQERVALVGGVFEIRSDKAEGTTINVCVPLEEKA